ncbi:MAG: M56 family metallopeptidase [Bacteroidetes bacterium]|nr:M56 family metallopeptidase [Bacteroidota bacterium]
MINFIITSFVLSLTGWLVYMFLVRRKASAQQRKGFIYVTLVGSLLLPLTVHNSPPILKPTPYVAPLQFGQDIEHHHLQQYCRCQTPNYSHRITYRANAFYNLMLSHKHWLSRGIGGAIALFLFHFICQLLYLQHLVSRSDKERREMAGIPFFLLKTPYNHSVGAFQLRKRYVIWQEEMKQLSDLEIEAILRHELSHLQQFNTFEKAVLRIIQCFWFFSPVFYFFKKELDLISECIADETGSEVMGNRKAYAQLLVKLKSLQSIPLVQPFTGSILRKRIDHLLRKPHTHNRKMVYVGLVVLGALQLTLVSPLSAQIEQTMYELETYEEIYHKVNPDKSEAVYCQDCETVCVPEGE